MFDKINNPDLKTVLGKLYFGLLIFGVVVVLVVLAFGAHLLVNGLKAESTTVEIANLKEDVGELRQLINIQNVVKDAVVPAASNIVLVEDLGGVTQDQPCIEDEKVTHLQYIKVGNEPIPAGERVEFVQTCKGETAIKWVEIKGRGQTTHFYVLDGLSLNFRDYGDQSSSSTYEDASPSGVVANLNYYSDFKDQNGDYVEGDGVIDSLSFSEVVEWTEVEIGLIELGNEFYSKALESSFFYFSYATDCQASEYRMNGKPIEPAEYGGTYKVPANGGVLEAFYKAGKCGWYDQDTVRWTVEVMPGDFVGGTEDIFATPMKDPDPWVFCSKMDWMVPSWESEKYIPYEVKDACPSLVEKGDYSPEATLSREGFLRADSRYGDDLPVGWVPFVSQAEGRKINYSWPQHSWVGVENIVLNEDNVYNVTLDAENRPIISFVGGEFESSSSYNSDIPWYGDYGTEIVFLTDEGIEDFTFDWAQTLMFRINYTNGVLSIQKAVWSPE